MGDLRSLDEQQGPKKAAEIREICRRLDNIRFGGGAAHYYAKEVRTSLLGGALLAAVSMSGSLLEIVVRELVLGHAERVARSGLPLQYLLEQKGP